MGPSAESFHYSRVSSEWGVLRLLASLGEAGSHFVPSGAHLMVEPGPGSLDVYYAPARKSSLERRLLTHTRQHGSQLLWRAVFALPLEVIEFPEAIFQVVALEGFSLPLPTPGLQLTLDQLAARTQLTLRAPQLRPTTTVRVRQRAAALATAVAVTAGSTPAVALAAGSTGGSLSTTTPTSAPAPTTGAPAATASTSGVVTTAATSSHGLAHPGQAQAPLLEPLAFDAPQGDGFAQDDRSCDARRNGACEGDDGVLHHVDRPRRDRLRRGHHARRRHDVGAAALPRAGRTSRHDHALGHGGHGHEPEGRDDDGRRPAQVHERHDVNGHDHNGHRLADPGSGSPTTGTGSPKTGTHPSDPTTKTHAHKSHAHKTPHHTTHPHTSGGAAVAQSSPKPQPAPTTTTPTQPVGTLSPSAPGISVPKGWTGTVSADPALTGAVNNLSGLLSNGDRPPSFLIPIYMEAGKKYDVPWEVLAAINAIETDYGQNLNTSSAGAVGWMQFEPSTWAKYGEAVDGHSVPNPYDPRDAIFAAAKYLAAAGAKDDVARAVYAYNHASWYVDEVMSRAHAIATHAQYQRMTVKHGTFSVDFATGVKTTPVVRYSSGVLSHFDRLIAAANMVSAADFPYVYGGGHEQPSVFAPFDCSGSVSYVMQQAGYNVPTTVSGDIPIWKFPAGPGKVTIFYNSWHTFMRIGNRYFGTSGFARPGGGAGWFDVDKLPSGYLAEFKVVHVPNLGVNSFAPGQVYTPLNLPKPKRVSKTLDIPVSMQLSTLGSFPSA